MALTIDPKRIDIMKERPRASKEQLVNSWMIVLIGIVSAVAGLVAFASFFVVYKNTNNLVLARSIAFITLGFNSLAYVFSIRTLMSPFWKNHIFENKWLILAVLVGFTLQIFPFMTLATRQFFGLTNVDLIYWVIAAGVSLLMFLVIEIFKSIYRFSGKKQILK